VAKTPFKELEISGFVGNRHRQQIPTEKWKSFNGKQFSPKNCGSKNWKKKARGRGLKKMLYPHLAPCTSFGS